MRPSWKSIPRASALVQSEPTKPASAGQASSYGAGTAEEPVAAEEAEQTAAASDAESQRRELSLQSRGSSALKVQALVAAKEEEEAKEAEVTASEGRAQGSTAVAAAIARRASKVTALSQLAAGGRLQPGASKPEGAERKKQGGAMPTASHQPRFGLEAAEAAEAAEPGSPPAQRFSPLGAFATTTGLAFGRSQRHMANLLAGVGFARPAADAMMWRSINPATHTA